jgi:hypothetical protein
VVTRGAVDRGVLARPAHVRRELSHDEVDAIGAVLAAPGGREAADAAAAGRVDVRLEGPPAEVVDEVERSVRALEERDVLAGPPGSR